jgi:protein phosphatase
MKLIVRWRQLRDLITGQDHQERGAPPAPPPRPLRTSPELAAKPPPPGIIGGFMFEAFGASDPGCVRTNNEDYYLVAPSLGLYAVADGMGGAQAGEHASKLAVETLWEEVYQSNGAVDEDLLVKSFHLANDRVREAALADRSMEGMGTTLVAAVEKDQGLLVASVGDSRLYLFANGELTSVTEDQTWVNEVGRRLGIEEEQLKSHPMRHVLTMAIGVSENLRVMTYRLIPTSGALVLLCSDGLHGVAQPDEIRDILALPDSLEQKSERLIALARERGGPDNITVVLLRAR